MPNEDGFPTDAEMAEQREEFQRHSHRLLEIINSGFDVRQDAIMAGALINYLFGKEGTPERNKFDIYATSFYGTALDTIDEKIANMQEEARREYTRNQLLSGVKSADLRFPHRRNPHA